MLPAAVVLLTAPAVPVGALLVQGLARILHAERRPRRGPDHAVRLQPVRALEGTDRMCGLAAEDAVRRQLQSVLQPTDAGRLDLRSGRSGAGGVLLRGGMLVRR